MISDMMTQGNDTLLSDASIEITSKDIARVKQTTPLLPTGTQISITHLPGEPMEARIVTAASIRALGLVPVPHIAARAIQSAGDLETQLTALRENAEVDRLFLIAGDTPDVQGPFKDSMAVLKSDVIARSNLSHIAIGGYPDGHATIADDLLWAALREKTAFLRQSHMDHSIITQFGFDADTVLLWLEQLRQEGIDALVRIGVPGPASMKTLILFAARCGVGASKKVLAKYGLSVSRLLNVTGPDVMIRRFSERLDPKVHGNVRLHFFPFGGIARTVQWIDEWRIAEAQHS